VQVGDLIEDNNSGRVGIVMAVDADSLGSSKIWIGFKYLSHVDGMTFWQSAEDTTLISSR